MGVQWQPLDRRSVLQTWQWRDEVRQQIVNTDIDGLMTAALLHQLKGWPIAGFYDTETLWLSESTVTPLDLGQTLWVDVDMCWPGARSLSQHVVTVSPSLRGAVAGHATTINPNLAVGCHGGHAGAYRDKYPFGTFQWAAWIAGSPRPPALSDYLCTGLAWMPDGGFVSVNHPSWRQNCLNWSTVTLPGSVLSPLAVTGTAQAQGIVRAAARHLAGSAPILGSWRNLQYVMAQAKGGGCPVIDPATTQGRDDVQGVVDRLTQAFGWRPLHIPLTPERYVGTWQTSTSPPPGWPGSANTKAVVSMAITGMRQYCWTTPTNNRGLPHLRAALP